MPVVPSLLANAAASSSALQNTGLVEVIESYERYYASGTSHTARAKRLDLQHFVKFLTSFRGCSKPEKLRVVDWDFSSVQRFLEEQLLHGESPATVARRLATIKHMGRTLSERVAGFVNPAREVKAPKIETLRPQAISKRELGAIRRKAKQILHEKTSFIHFRNFTLLSLLLDTGIRADEIRTLRRSQLDDNLEWLRNVRTKGRRYRNVYVTSCMRKLLAEYLERRESELKKFFPKLIRRVDQELPLFISTYGAKCANPDSFMLGAKTLWRAVHEFSVERRLHPHLLRHSYALDLLDHSSDIRLVSQALGHSDEEIPAAFLRRPSAQWASHRVISKRIDYLQPLPKRLFSKVRLLLKMETTPMSIRSRSYFLVSHESLLPETSHLDRSLFRVRLNE